MIKKDPKSNILSFIKTLVPKVIYKTINILLSPCCDNINVKTIDITGLEIDGIPVNSEDVRIFIITKDLVGYASGTTNGSGNLTIS